MDGQKVWVVKNVKLQPMCAGEGQQAPYRASSHRDEIPDDLSRSKQAPYRASSGQPMETDARPIPARSHRDARDGALEKADDARDGEPHKADDARDGAQRRRQSVSRIVTAPRMRNLIRSDCIRVHL